MTVPGFGTPFRYYFCQREAMETLAWLVEIRRQTRCRRFDPVLRKGV